jgi:predicted phosphoribosyltransferase
VRKIRIADSTESGFGPVTWDGLVLIHDRLRDMLGLSATEVGVAIANTKKNVSERVARFSGGKMIPPLAGKTVILTDDGLASGFTMLAAIQSIRKTQARRYHYRSPHCIRRIGGDDRPSGRPRGLPEHPGQPVVCSDRCL